MCSKQIINSEQILKTWRTLDDAILALTEQEVWDILTYELAHQRRRLFVKRLFGRANRLRENRELEHLLRGIN